MSNFGILGTMRLDKLHIASGIGIQTKSTQTGFPVSFHNPQDVHLQNLKIQAYTFTAQHLSEFCGFIFEISKCQKEKEKLKCHECPANPNISDSRSRPSSSQSDRHRFT